MITKARIIKLNTLIRHYLQLWYKYNFNSTVRQQLKDYKSIPILIISFNQLKYLKKLVRFLLKHNYSNIIILDNNSTYTPLLNYFEEIKQHVTIHRLKNNSGHLSFWKHETIFKKYSKGYYVVSDADIVPLDTCPEDFLQTFMKLLDMAYDRTKVGFSLKLDDIPESNPNKEDILKWEEKYWNSIVKRNVYKAEIDTTFALYRPNYTYKLKHFTKAWRTDDPIQAIHGGWYIDLNNLTEEQAYYIKTANTSASWRVNKKGELIDQKHKPLYSK